MISVIDQKTGLTFEFETHKEKEFFFELWDKHEVIGRQTYTAHSTHDPIVFEATSLTDAQAQVLDWNGISVIEGGGNK